MGIVLAAQVGQSNTTRQSLLLVFRGSKLVYVQKKEIYLIYTVYSFVEGEKDSKSLDINEPSLMDFAHDTINLTQDPKLIEVGSDEPLGTYVGPPLTMATGVCPFIPYVGSMEGDIGEC